MALWLCAMAMLSACVFEGGGGPVQPPAGLGYATASAIYEAGRPIPPNTPTASGDPVERYEVAPPLPPGLSIDAHTGVITGTPTAASAPAVHVVTAINAAGRATARVAIEVRDALAAPAGLSYPQAAPVYTVGQSIAANTPTGTGGPVAVYTIAPALPAGLAFDASTGEISGTPTVVAPEALYIVTGRNDAGSAQASLRLAVQAAMVAPASLAYGTHDALYVAGETIVPNTVQVTGGPASAFTVTPALPAGLSLHAQTGAITGTPASLQAPATYTVTASNAAGSASTQVRMTVTSRGSWSSVAPIVPGRHYHSVSSLSDGKVLAVGGFTAGGVTTSAALYDPANDTWTPAASMLSARYDHTATVLADGRVLVVGGQPSVNASMASVEIYDPVSNTWTAAASMSEPRVRHSATVLPDGSVLVIGGYSAGGSLSFSDTAERYDPASDTWTRLNTRLSAARGQHAAELLPGGNTILLAGGVNRQGFVVGAELFAVDDSGPSRPAGGGVSGNVAQSVRLADGSVLVTSDSGSTAWRFHPATTAWTTSTYAANRSLPTMTALADGRVLLAGGSSLATAEIYNPDANVWTDAASMLTARRASAATLLPDGSVLVVGGFSGTGGEVDGVERYRP